MNLLICSWDGVPTAIETFDVTAVVSIGDPGERLPHGLDGFAFDVLRVEFEDLIATETQIDQYKAAGSISTYDVFEPEHADAIIDFAQARARRESDLLVHCAAGVSRSTAVTVLAAAIAGASPADSINEARAAHHRTFSFNGPRTFDPNARVLALGSEAIFGDRRLLHAWVAHRQEQQLPVSSACQRWS